MCEPRIGSGRTIDATIKELIGGAKISVGDQVIDGTVRGKLDAIVPIDGGNCSACRINLAPQVIVEVTKAKAMRLIGACEARKKEIEALFATRWFDHEGDILRFVFFHSLALAALVGVLVTLQAYVWPFTAMVVH